MTVRHELTRHGKRLGTAFVALSLLFGLQTIAAPPAQAIGATLTVTGTLKVGQTLTVTPSGFSTTPSSYSWYSYAAASGGSGAWVGGGSTYNLGDGDVGRYLVAYTITDGGIFSERMGPVVGFTKGTPSISGSASVGGLLTADTGTWSPTPDSFSYQWMQDGSDISGATSATYTVASADKNTKISVKVTAAKTDYPDTSATSAEVGPVVAEFVAGTPTVSGTLMVGSSVWADPGTWDPTPDSYAFQWLRDGSAITGATDEFYRLTSADLGKKISVRVTASKAGIDDLSATSAQTDAVVAAPAATLTAFTAGDVVIGTGRCVAVPVSATYQVSTYEAWAVTKVTLTSKVTNKRGKKIGTVTLTGSGPDYTPASAGSVSPNRRADLIGTATGTFLWCTGDYLGAIKFAAPKGTWTGTFDSGAVGGSITSTLTATGHVKAALRVATPKLTVKGTKRTLTASFKTWVPDVKGWRALVGTKVTVQKLVDGSWVKLKTIRLSASGKVKTSWKATESASYRLAYAGSSITTDGVTAVVTG